MATVKMKKGSVYADVFDSPETIRNAQLEGYSLCDEKSPDTVVKEAIVDALKVEEKTEKQSEEQKIVHKKTNKK